MLKINILFDNCKCRILKIIYFTYLPLLSLNYILSKINRVSNNILFFTTLLIIVNNMFKKYVKNIYSNNIIKKKIHKYV